MEKAAGKEGSMLHAEKELFAGRVASETGLKNFGFLEREGGFFGTFEILGGDFLVEVEVKEGVFTRTIERETGEEYSLHLVEGAEGSFVSRVREEYLALLGRISEECFEGSMFRGSFVRAVIDYVARAYGRSPEFLWDDLDAAVWRREDTGKWFGAMMNIPRSKLGGGEGNFDVLDVHASPEKIDALVDGKNFFRGYHMNKKHWLTVPLDGRVELARVCALLDESYLLAKKK